MGRPLTNFDGAALDGTVRPTLGHEEGLVRVACTACCRAVQSRCERGHAGREKTTEGGCYRVLPIRDRRTCSSMPVH